MNTRPTPPTLENPTQGTVPDYHQSGHLNYVLLMFGKSIPMAHSPYVAIVNAPIQNGAGEPSCLHEILWDCALQQRKIPESLREIVLKMTDATIAQVAPVELPFITDKQGSFAVECFWGRKRYIAYVDPTVQEKYTFKEIPVAADDPEKYITSCMST